LWLQTRKALAVALRAIERLITRRARNDGRSL
jgi:hypothetical protein